MSLPINYCASFQSSETRGATGYFGVSLNDGSASYSVNLNLLYMVVNQATTCNFTLGLQYHIASFWNASTRADSGRGRYACSSIRYDPNFACAGPTTNPAWQCAALNRPVFVNNSRCNPSTYGAGMYDLCPVGDLSSKFGRLFSTMYPGTNVQTYSFISPPGTLVDYQPPWAAAFNGNGTLYPAKWSSVVFSCDNNPLVCARLRYVPNGAASPCGFPTIQQAPPPADLDDTGIAIVIVSSLFFVYVVVSCVLYFSGYCAKKAPKVSYGFSIDDLHDLQMNTDEL